MALIDCPECGNEVSENAESCPDCGEPISSGNNSDSSGCGKGCAFVIAAPFLFFLVFMIVSGVVVDSGDNGSSTPRSDAEIRPSETRELNHNNAPSFLATSDQAWEEMTTYIHAKDKEGVQRLMRQGMVYDIRTANRVRIIETGFTSHRVRVLDGSNKGIEGWVYKEIVE